jgi:hypothetical protein
MSRKPHSNEHNPTQENQIQKADNLPKSDGIARAGADSSKPSQSVPPVKPPESPPQPPAPAAPQPAQDMQNIPAGYGLEQSENEGTRMADLAFDAIEYAFQKRAEERAQRFVQMANAMMASFAKGMAARSSEIRSTYLPENYSRRELPQGEDE